MFKDIFAWAVLNYILIAVAHWLWVKTHSHDENAFINWDNERKKDETETNKK